MSSVSHHCVPSEISTGMRNGKETRSYPQGTRGGVMLANGTSVANNNQNNLEIMAIRGTGFATPGSS